MSEEIKKTATEVVEGFSELTEENKRVITAYVDGLAMGVKIGSKKETENEESD